MEVAWGTVRAKVQASVRHIVGFGLFLRDRVTAYRVFTFSLAGYLLQFLQPSQGLLRAEAGAQASVMAAPMHAFTSDVLPFLRSIGCSFEVPSFWLARQAVALRTNLRHPEVDEMLDAIRVAASHDDILLVPLADPRPRRNVLSRMRWARSQASFLLDDVRHVVNLHVAVYAHLRAEERDHRTDS